MSVNCICLLNVIYTFLLIQKSSKVFFQMLYTVCIFYKSFFLIEKGYLDDFKLGSRVSISELYAICLSYFMLNFFYPRIAVIQMVPINAGFMNMIKRTNMYFIDRFGSVNSINTYPRLKFVLGGGVEFLDYFN